MNNNKKEDNTEIQSNDSQIIKEKSRRQIRAEEKIKDAKKKKIIALAAIIAVFILVVCISLFSISEYQKDAEIRPILKAAKAGDSEAQYELGMIYYSDRDRQDDQKAVEWLEKSADQKNTKAQFQLGTMYSGGNGVDQDPEKSMDYLQAAAEGNLPIAQYYLAYSYDQGIKPLERDVNKGIEWAEKSANQGYADALFLLGFMYLRSDPVDEAKGFEWLLKLSETDKNELLEEKYSYTDSYLNYELGRRYLNGIGIDKNVEKALEYLTKADELNSAEAQYQLGLMYQLGEDVEKDLTKAVEFFTKSSDQGLAQAKYELGLMYKLGEGVEKDLTKAVEFLTDVADRGYPQAKYELGLMYESGEGVEKDLEKSNELIQEAADEGYTLARQHLGILEDETTETE